MAKRGKKQQGQAPGPVPVPADAPDPGPLISPTEGIPPPDASGIAFPPLLYPGPSGLVRAVLLNDSAFGWMSHWYEGRTTPHLLDGDECPGCKAGQMPRWNAYIYCLTDPTRRFRIMQISGEAWTGCPDLRTRQGALRGLIVTLRRTGAAKNGKVVALVTVARPADDLPPGRDVRPMLCRYWGMKPDWLEWQSGPHNTGINQPSGGEVQDP